MKRRKKAEAMENITPNLIPMIDIMFLLLLFFMLGADMSQRQLEEIKLPQASQVKEDPNKGKEEGEGITTINVHHSPDRGVQCALHAGGGTCREATHWKWAIYGHEFDKQSLKERLQIDAQKYMDKEPDPVAKKILTGLKVLIRADAAAPYGDIQKIIEICGTVGIYKIEVGAAKPAPPTK